MSGAASGVEAPQGQVKQPINAGHGSDGADVPRSTEQVVSRYASCCLFIIWCCGMELTGSSGNNCLTAMVTVWSKMALSVRAILPACCTESCSSDVCRPSTC